MTTALITAELATTTLDDLAMFAGTPLAVTWGDEEMPGCAGELIVDGGVVKAAVISDCTLYRYLLIRAWDLTLPLLVFVMLNPSTATASLDDPTIRRCMGFARRDGYGGIIVVNLFAFRSPSPEAMKASQDPVGPLNADILDRTFAYAVSVGADVIAGWGVHGEYRDQDYHVIARAEAAGIIAKCLGKSKGGHPRHPLYIKGEQLFVPLRDVEAA